MKIVTVNVPKNYIKAIEKFTGENGTYPSRSEFIRIAIRSFLIRELQLVKNYEKYSDHGFDDFEEEFDDKQYVRIPINTSEVVEIPQEETEVIEYKTYKVIKRLEDIEDKKDNTPKKTKPQKKAYKPKKFISIDPKEFVVNQIVSILYEKGPQSATNLADLMGLSPSSIYLYIKNGNSKFPGLIHDEKHSYEHIYSLNEYSEYLGNKLEPPEEISSIELQIHEG